MAQDQTPTSTPAPSATGSSDVTSTTAAPTTSISSEATTATSEDHPLELWSIADSLISSYYPSSTITNVASLTWPANVVIGSSTYSIHPEATLSSTSLSNNKPATTIGPVAAPKEGPSNPKHTRDRTLGIALGVVFGVIGAALVAFILFCLHRRRKSSIRRGTSITDDEIGTWRSPQPEMGTVSTVTGPLSRSEDGPSRAWLDRYNRLSNQHTPPVHLHPAFTHRQTDDTNTSSEENPFFTPMERSQVEMQHYPEYHPEDTEYHPGFPGSQPVVPAASAAAYAPVTTRQSQSSHRRSSSSARPDPDFRPPTPFSPMMMLSGSPPARNNPFASPEDHVVAAREAMARQEAEEEDDLVSPIQPPQRSPRRNSPLVHYPSWGEVSEFDFSGEDRNRGRGLREQSSSSSGGDGYRRERESVVGRTELA